MANQILEGVVYKCLLIEKYLKMFFHFKEKFKEIDEVSIKIKLRKFGKVPIKSVFSIYSSSQVSRDRKHNSTKHNSIGGILKYDQIKPQLNIPVYHIPKQCIPKHVERRPYSIADLFIALRHYFGCALLHLSWPSAMFYSGSSHWHKGASSCFTHLYTLVSSS